MQTAISTLKTINDLSSIVANMDQSVQVMDSERIATTMYKFGELCNEFKQKQRGIVDSSMYFNSASTIPTK